MAKTKCQSCGKKAETSRVDFYYWRMYVCNTCKNKMRKNGHIK